MRDIRAWDDVAKRMLYGKVEQFDDMLGYRFDHHFESETPIYMWSTGLKDRTGKEIYEGDILSFKDNWDGADISIPERVGFVGYSDGSFMIKRSACTHYRWMDYDCEIIGNRWEHPDLLGGRT